jgi:cytochrome c biogenesis protein ResB
MVLRLVGALIFVFFFSHKRVWAQVVPRPGGTAEIVLAGDANRNNIAFSDKFNKIVDSIGPRSEQ